jgi:chromosome segregation and condensation protein ScpB
MESLTSQNILQWVRDPGNQMIVAAVAAVLLLVVLWLVLSRRRQHAERTRADERAEWQPKRSELEDILESYRLSHPAFYGLLKTVQEKHSLDELSEKNKEFAGAVAKLRLIHAARRASRSSKASSALLRLDAERGTNSSREVRAAMITIIRILYASPETRSTLESTGEIELDRVVESLTD